MAKPYGQHIMMRHMSIKICIYMIYTTLNWLSGFYFAVSFFSSFFQATSAPIFRIQENSPQFRLNNLEPGREYQFLVYAVNAKGRSEPPVVIERVRVAAQLGPYGEYPATE